MLKQDQQLESLMRYAIIRRTISILPLFAAASIFAIVARAESSESLDRYDIDGTLIVTGMLYLAEMNDDDFNASADLSCYSLKQRSFVNREEVIYFIAKRLRPKHCESGYSFSVRFDLEGSAIACNKRIENLVLACGALSSGAQ